MAREAIQVYIDICLHSNEGEALAPRRAFLNPYGYEGNRLSRKGEGEADAVPRESSTERRGRYSRRSVVAVVLSLGGMGGSVGWYLFAGRAGSSTQLFTTMDTKQGLGKSTEPATANPTRTANQQGTQAPAGQSTPTAAQANAAPTTQSTAPGVAQPTSSGVSTSTATTVALTVKIDTGQLPSPVIYSHTYSVPVTTSKPGCTVVLTADYATSGGHQNIGTQSTDSQGSTVFSRQVKAGLLSSSVTLTATATNAAGNQATTQEMLQAGLL